MVWEGIQTLGFQVLLGTLAGWSPKAPLSQPFRVCKAECVSSDISVHLNLCVPHPTKHKKVAQTTTEPSVFAMVWEGIQTLGFQDITKMPLSPPFRVCKAESV